MLTKIKKILRNNFLVWKYYLNFKASLNYSSHPVTIESNEIGNILQTLRKNGIAMADAKQVLGEQLYNELEMEANQLKNSNSAMLSDKRLCKVLFGNDL